MKLRPDHVGIAVIVGCLFALQPLATDLYLASLPALRREFGATVAEAQLTLAVFSFAFGLSQLVYGPFSDRFGRRPTLIFGACLYTIASLGCSFAPSLGWLIVGRFFQAVGACAGQVVGRAIIRDNHEGAAAARMFGLIATGVVLVPVVGPTIGGMLQSSFGWPSVFVMVGLTGMLVAIAVISLLPETNRHKDPHATAPRSIARNFAMILRHREFIGFTLVTAFAYAGVAVWLSLSPFVLIELLGLSPTWFGVVFGAPVIGYIVTNFMVARLVTRYGILRLLHVGTLGAAAAGTISIGLALAGQQSIAAIALPTLLYMVAIGLNQPAGTAGAITPFARHAGSAAALLGCIQMLTGAAAGFLSARLHTGTTLVLAAGLAVAGWGGYLTFRLILQRR